MRVTQEQRGSLKLEAYMRLLQELLLMQLQQASAMHPGAAWTAEVQLLLLHAAACSCCWTMLLLMCCCCCTLLHPSCCWDGMFHKIGQMQTHVLACECYVQVLL